MSRKRFFVNSNCTYSSVNALQTMPRKQYKSLFLKGYSFANTVSHRLNVVASSVAWDEFHDADDMIIMSNSTPTLCEPSQKPSNISKQRVYYIVMSMLVRILLKRNRKGAICASKGA